MGCNVSKIVQARNTNTGCTCVPHGRGHHIGGRRGSVCSHCHLAPTPPPAAHSRTAWLASNQAPPTVDARHQDKVRGLLGLPSWFSWRRDSVGVVNVREAAAAPPVVAPIVAAGESGNNFTSGSTNSMVAKGRGSKLSASQVNLTMSSQDIVAAATSACGQPTAAPSVPLQGHAHAQHRAHPRHGAPTSLAVKPVRGTMSPLVSPPRLLRDVAADATHSSARLARRLRSRSTTHSGDAALPSTTAPLVSRGPRSHSVATQQSGRHVWIDATLWESTEDVRMSGGSGSAANSTPRSSVGSPFPSPGGRFRPSFARHMNSGGSPFQFPSAIQRYEQYQEATAVRFRGTSRGAITTLSAQSSRVTDDDGDDSHGEESSESEESSAGGRRRTSSVTGVVHAVNGGSGASAGASRGSAHGAGGARGRAAGSRPAFKRRAPPPLELMSTHHHAFPMLPSVLFSPTVFQPGFTTQEPSVLDIAFAATPDTGSAPRREAKHRRTDGSPLPSRSPSRSPSPRTLVFSPILEDESDDDIVASVPVRHQRRAAARHPRRRGLDFAAHLGLDDCNEMKGNATTSGEGGNDGDATAVSMPPLQQSAVFEKHGDAHAIVGTTRPGGGGGGKRDSVDLHAVSRRLQRWKSDDKV